MIATGGLKPADYDEVYAGATPERYAALKSGSVAASIILPPWDFVAIDEGFVSLGSFPAVVPVFPYTGFVGHTDLATKRPEAVAGFVKGYPRGVRWLNDPANKARAVSILAANVNTKTDVGNRTYDEIVIKSKCFPSTAHLEPKSLQVVADMLAQIGAVKPPIPALDLLIDNRFANAADAELKREKI